MDEDMMSYTADALGMVYDKNDPIKTCYVCKKTASYPGYFEHKDLGIVVCMACVVGIGFENEGLTEEDILNMIIADYLAKEHPDIKHDN